MKPNDYNTTPRGNISSRIRTGRYNASKRGYAAPNVTIDQVITAFETQLGLCAACAVRLEYGKAGYCIDHCHETGAFRGLICRECNWIEGLADTPDRLEAVAKYMRRFVGTSA